MQSVLTAVLVLLAVSILRAGVSIAVAAWWLPASGEQSCLPASLSVCRCSDTPILVCVIYCQEQVFLKTNKVVSLCTHLVDEWTWTRFAYSAAKGLYSNVLLSLQLIAHPHTFRKRSSEEEQTQTFLKVWLFLARYERLWNPHPSHTFCVPMELEKPPRSLGCWMNKIPYIIPSLHSSQDFLLGVFSHPDSLSCQINDSKQDCSLSCSACRAPWTLTIFQHLPTMSLCTSKLSDFTERDTRCLGLG